MHLMIQIIRSIVHGSLRTSSTNTKNLNWNLKRNWKKNIKTIFQKKKPLCKFLSKQLKLKNNLPIIKKKNIKRILDLFGEKHEVDFMKMKYKDLSKSNPK